MKREAILICLTLLLAAAVPAQELPPSKKSRASTRRTPDVKPSSGFVTTKDNVRIHHLEVSRDREDSSAPALLFIPGWTMPAEIWDPQIRHFGKTHRVVAMDPRGQGRSAKPREGYYPAARARDIKDVVDKLKLAPVVLIGWSMGVAEIAAYVEQFGTAGVAGIVLVDGFAGADGDPKFTAGMVNLAAMHLKDREAAAGTFVKSMYKNPEVLQDEKYLARIKAASLKTPTDAAVALFVGIVTTDNRKALEKIDKPTLIVTAPNPTLEPLAEDMQKRIAGSKREVFAGAGHALFVDQPERFNSVLEQFLQALAPTREKLR